MSGDASQRFMEELEIHIENLKNEATKQFDDEHYAEALKSFQFLSDLNPKNRNYRDYLTLCRQMVSEQGSPSEPLDLDGSSKPFSAVGLEFKESAESSTEAAPSPEKKCEALVPVVRALPARQIVSPTELSPIPSSSVAPYRPSRTVRLLKRIGRVAALVAVILLLGGVVSRWVHQVRAPHQTEVPVVRINVPPPAAPVPSTPNTAESKTAVSEAPAEESSKIEPKAEVGKPLTQEAPKAESPKRSEPAPPGPDPSMPMIFAVTHEHRFGSCHGELKLSPRFIRFVAMDGSGDGFQRSPNDILGVELERWVKIKFDDRTYRFKPLSARGPLEERLKLRRLFLELMKLRRDNP
ncbi:MAG: hypothetical protein U0V70_15110 [Terriglobia bacterium]